mmetsp:Transcript_41483/g.77180  ORF Transcript_41483/g.77180 Transcript_41483/m.77180 type:complete len:408 (-) Transcript_41483:118-1341(-)
MSKDSYAQLKCEQEPPQEVDLAEKLSNASADDLRGRGSLIHPSFEATTVPAQNKDSKIRRIRIFGIFGLLMWVIIGLVAYMSGYVVVGPEGRGLTVVQSLYLMSQIISTIGYGDYVPRSIGGQLFVVFHILFAGILITGMVTEAIDWFVAKHTQASSAMVHSFLSDEVQGEERLWPVIKSLLLAGFFFLTSITIWALFFVNFCDIFHMDTDESWDGLHNCEGLSYVDAVYFAVVTFVTLGFGDITPQTAGGEAFACIFSLVGIASYLNLVGAVTNSFLKVKERIKIDRISKEELARADEDGSGHVDLFEFTRFILTKFNMVDRQVLQEIKQNFKHLDKDGSGFLERRDLEDLNSIWEARKHQDGQRRPSIRTSIRTSCRGRKRVSVLRTDPLSSLVRGSDSITTTYE